MAIFLFLKQFVDMLYQWQWLDVIMVLAIMPMIIYQYLLVRPDIKKILRAPDVIIFALIVLITVSFSKDTVSYREYIKVLSAFLLYFMGRLYYDRIVECNDALAISSYCIVYLNFAHRIAVHGIRLFSVKNAYGDFYYYDTDMAFAMILSFIFIAMYAKKSVLKIITVCLVCPYMVLFSDADVQKMIFGFVVIVMALYFVDVALRKRGLSVIGLAGLLLMSGAMIVLAYLPLFEIYTFIYGWLVYQARILSYANMKTRYWEWGKVIAVNWPSTPMEYLFGMGMNTTLPLKSLYLKIIFSIGIVGLALSALLVILIFRAAMRTRDRKSFYVLVSIALLTLLTGTIIDSMESTQMSWFVMLFSGMVVSSDMKDSKAIK